jgi:hypothetical protein
MIDPTFRVFAPPVDIALTSVDAIIANWIIVIQSAIILGAIVFAGRYWVKSKSPMLALILVGGAVANLAEPFVDLVGACWHPIINQHTLFENMDRPLPVWLFFSYITYFGCLTMWTFNAFNRGASRRAIWLWFLVPVAFDILMEEAMLGFSNSLYVYYGNQPLKIHGFPIWWAAANGSGIMISALVITLFASTLRGWRMLAVPFITIMSYGAAMGMVALPSIIVINSEFPNWVTQLGGIATFFIAFLVVQACAGMISTDSPQNIRSAFDARQIHRAVRSAGA